MPNLRTVAWYGHVLTGILTWFLLASGTARADSVPLVRIGIVTQASEVELSATSAWQIGILHTGFTPTRVEPDVRWRLAARSGALEVWDELGRFRGARGDTLFAYSDSGHALQVDGRPYRGEFLLWAGETGIVVVNVVDLESYLRGVVPLEIGEQPADRVEAAKAQAVAARSYTVAMLRRWAKRGFDLMATVEDQVYGGLDAEKPWSNTAVDATRGVIATFAERPIQAFYCSTCGGHTASPKEVWGSEDPGYLRGVRCKSKRVEDSFCSVSPRYIWTEDWDGAAFEGMLDASLPGQASDWDRERYGSLRDIEIASRGPSKRVARLILHFDHGTVELGGDSVRWALRTTKGQPLWSAMLVDARVERERGRVTRVGIRGRGYGHGIGLCQYGAMGMAASGYDYREILGLYYRGSDLVRFY